MIAQMKIMQKILLDGYKGKEGMVEEDEKQSNDDEEIYDEYYLHHFQ